MKTLLNTLYVTSSEAYLGLDGENVVIRIEKETIGRVPIHNIDGVVTFGYQGASPQLMNKLASQQKTITFLDAYGNFRAKVQGPTHGNVYLRRQQYRYADSIQSLDYAKSFIIGKVYNQKIVLYRAIRDHALRINVEEIQESIQVLQKTLPLILNAETKEELRGIEGITTQRYFSVLDQLILNQKETFFFQKRTRRPPLDSFNCLISFLYMLLVNTVGSALEMVGIDPYVGMFHTDRSGRKSMALDLMEELRAPFVDRLAITLVNRRQVQGCHFEKQENGAVYLTDTGRKIVLNAWQEKKSEDIEHPFLKEKIKWGLIPHMQAMLLARTIRGDLDTYPPFLWR